MAAGHTLPRRMRLSRGGDFLNVRNRGLRVNAGPLLVYAYANRARHPRLGLGISVRAGNAVRRNAIKRRLREAFRLGWGEWPVAPSPTETRQATHLPEDQAEARAAAGYDVVISARAHEPLAVEAYRQLLLTAVQELDATWRKKLRQRRTRGNMTDT